MNNVIEINSKRSMPSILRVVHYILAQNQTIIIGTDSIERRMKELEIWFPDAKLEIVDIGIKICNRIK